MFFLSPLFNIFLQPGKSGILATILFTLSFSENSIPENQYKITSMDGEFTMEVSREGREVKLKIQFTDVSKYKHAIIEKSDDLKNEFRQCAYVDLRAGGVKNGMVDKMDKYPRMYSSSFYRLRTVTKEGIERTYPGVELPPMTQ